MQLVVKAAGAETQTKNWESLNTYVQISYADRAFQMAPCLH